MCTLALQVLPELAQEVGAARAFCSGGAGAGAAGLAVERRVAAALKVHIDLHCIQACLLGVTHLALALAYRAASQTGWRAQGAHVSMYCIGISAMHFPSFSSTLAFRPAWLAGKVHLIGTYYTKFVAVSPSLEWALCAQGERV